jgi:hypothetical protein
MTRRVIFWPEPAPEGKDILHGQLQNSKRDKGSILESLERPLNYNLETILPQLR